MPLGLEANFYNEFSATLPQIAPTVFPNLRNFAGSALGTNLGFV